MKEHRLVLRTESDIFNELMEHEFIRGCEVKINHRNSVARITIKLSLFDYLFKVKDRLDRTHSILRGKIPFTMSYEIKFKPKIL